MIARQQIPAVAHGGQERRSLRTSHTARGGSGPRRPPVPAGSVPRHPPCPMPCLCLISMCRSAGCLRFCRSASPEVTARDASVSASLRDSNRYRGCWYWRGSLGFALVLANLAMRGYHRATRWRRLPNARLRNLWRLPGAMIRARKWPPGWAEGRIPLSRHSFPQTDGDIAEHQHPLPSVGDAFADGLIDGFLPRQRMAA